MDFSCADTVSCYFSRFLSESDFKPKTQLTFRAGLRCFMSWCLGQGVQVPDATDLCRWKTFLLSRYQTATAQTYLSAVKVFFRWLSDKGLGKNIGISVKGIKSEKVFRRDCLSDAGMKRILTFLEDKANAKQSCCYRNRKSLRDFVIVLLIVSCGLRVSEVSLLDVGDLDSVTGEPVIWVHGKGRNGKENFIPIPSSLKNLLFQYLEHRHPPLSRNSPMFVSYAQNSLGKRLSAKSISRIVKEAMVAVGFDSPRLTAHSLRHTAVTLALQGGATLQQVQQFARHRLIETTLRYAHNLEYARNPCSRLVMNDWTVGLFGDSIG